MAGGKEAKSPMAGVGVDKIADVLRLADWSCERIGDDLYFHGWRGDEPRNK
jgi:hypothetical protein